MLRAQELACEFAHRQQEFRLDIPCNWYGQEDRRTVLFYAPRKYSETLRFDVNDHLSRSEMEDHLRAQQSRIQNHLRQALDVRVELRDTTAVLDGLTFKGWAFNFIWEGEPMAGFYLAAYRFDRLVSVDWVAPTDWIPTAQAMLASFRWVGRP